MSNVRELATIHAPAEQTQMERKLKALAKPGKLELAEKNSNGVKGLRIVQPRRCLGASASAPATTPSAASLPSTPTPSVVENAISSRAPVASVLAGSVTYNASRAAGAATKLAAEHDHLLDPHKPELFDAGVVPDSIAAGGAGVSALTNLMSVGSNSLKLQRAKQSKKRNKEIARENAESGYAFVSTGGAEGSGGAYLKFNKATQPILVTRKYVSLSQLEQQIYGFNIGRYLANAVGSLSSFASYVGKAVGTTLSNVGQVAGVGGVIGGACEIATSATMLEKASWDLNSTQRRQAGLEKAAEEAGSISALEQGLHHAECKEQARRQKLARRSQVNAGVGILKGSVSIAAGIALIVISSIAVVATAGIWLAVAAGIATCALASWGLRHVWREGKVARHAKRRQRQAQALLATHSLNALETMIANQDAGKRMCKVVTAERENLISRNKRTRLRTVDVGQNGYLATEIRSRRLAARFGELKWDAKGKTRKMILAVLSDPPNGDACKQLGQESVNALRRLKYVGMKDMEILAMCQLALQEKDEAKRGALLRPQMASAHGLPWNAEKPLPAKAYLPPLIDLLKQQKGAAGYTQPDFAKLAADFRAQIGEANFGKFREAMNALPRAENNEIMRAAREVAKQDMSASKPSFAKSKAKIAAPTAKMIVQLDSESETDERTLATVGKGDSISLVASSEAVSLDLDDASNKA